MNVTDYLVHRLNRTAWLLGLAAATGATLASLVTPALGDPATVTRQAGPGGSTLPMCCGSVGLLIFTRTSPALPAATYAIAPTTATP